MIGLGGDASVERSDLLWRGIVAGFDGSAEAQCAVRWAALEAARRSCSLHLVRVVGSLAPVVTSVPTPIVPGEEQRRRDADDLLVEAEACRSVNDGLEVHSAALYDGPAAGRLAEYARNVSADVVVVGRPDPGASSRPVFGSISAELVRSTGFAVVAARRPTPVQEAAAATGYSPVLAVCDDGATSAKVLRSAFDIARRWGADVTVVHVEGRARNSASGVAPRVFRRQLDGCRAVCPEVSVRVEAIREQRVRAVLDRSESARLLVVGDRRYSTGHWLADTAGHAAMRYGGCSVMVV